jgi:hypothetical protein
VLGSTWLERISASISAAVGHGPSRELTQRNASISLNISKVPCGSITTPRAGVLGHVSLTVSNRYPSNKRRSWENTATWSGAEPSGLARAFMAGLRSTSRFSGGRAKVWRGLTHDPGSQGPPGTTPIPTARKDPIPPAIPSHASRWRAAAMAANGARIGKV